MNKTQRLRNIFDKLFRVKMAVILWVVHAILYGLCLFFCYIHNSHILMDIFGGVSGLVNIVAYVSSVGAIIRTFINKDLIVKRKILAAVLIVAVYFGTSGVLYLTFNNVAKEAEAEMERMLEEDGYKTELEEGDLSEWITEEEVKKSEEPDWGEE